MQRHRCSEGYTLLHRETIISCAQRLIVQEEAEPSFITVQVHRNAVVLAKRGTVLLLRRAVVSDTSSVLVVAPTSGIRAVEIITIVVVIVAGRRRFAERNNADGDVLRAAGGDFEVPGAGAFVFCLRGIEQQARQYTTA